MYIRNEKYVIEEVIKFIRRIFRYQSQWTNSGYEAITVATGSLTVFEQFSEAPEHYPVVIVAGGGSRSVNTAFNNIIAEESLEITPFGNNSLSYVPLQDGIPVAFGMPPVTNISGIDFFAFSESCYTSNSITAKIYDNYLASPVLLASGTLQQTATAYLPYRINLSTSVSGTGLYVTLEGSNSNIGIDTTSSYPYIISGTTYTGSLTGTLSSRVGVTLGGNFQITIQLRIQAKNDTALPRTIADLIEYYFQLFKSATFTRSSGAVNNTQLESSLNVREWMHKELYLESFQSGAVEVRRRGENDIIFTVPVTCVFTTSWNENYERDALESIRVETTSIDPLLY